MPQIEPGSKVLVRTAFNELLERRAVTGVVMGDDFEVVRVCAEEEWITATSEGRQPHSTPWPAEDVQPATDALGT
jgi:hypothetical protein